jgi:UDP-2,3-diacylglucosamine pyrophosphatase LpxH
MHIGNGLITRRGIVLSDLHLFARRSRGTDCVNSLRPEMASAEFIVLNGDIFDFRWSRLRDLETTVVAALNWLRDLMNDFPECRIHYVLGNHDCLTGFQDGLAALATTLPRLQWHEHVLRLGDALFLHGDCADEKMDPRGLRQYREPWENDRQRDAFAAISYIAADRLGLTHFTQAWHFPRRATVERIVHYLGRAWPDWQNTVRDCYFGHTHLPFSGYRHNGVAFHNTGSAIRGMDFNPIIFEMPAAFGETVSISVRNGQAC